MLVERVEGFASEVEWRRAYKEINDFEDALARDGIVLVKFWLQISAEEQLRRFEAREKEPWKQHKITAEDYRNREEDQPVRGRGRGDDRAIEHRTTRRSRWWKRTTSGPPA